MTSFLFPKICGKLEAIEGAAWIAGYAIFPLLSLSTKPKRPLIFLYLHLDFIIKMVWNVHLAVCDISLETTDVFVHDIHVLSVNEDEGFFGVETASDDILDIVITVFSVDLLFFHKIQILFSFCFTSMSASPLWKYFSSSVIWMTRGTLNASCKYLVKINGIKCPKCMASLEGPIF